MAKFPIHPLHPERVCWGCDKLCPADDLRCGNGSDRAQHPIELLGDDWWEWSVQQEAARGDGGAGLPAEPAQTAAVQK